MHLINILFVFLFILKNWFVLWFDWISVFIIFCTSLIWCLQLYTHWILLPFLKLCFCSVFFFETLCPFYSFHFAFHSLMCNLYFESGVHVGHEAIDACVWSISGKENGQNGDWLIGLQIQNMRYNLSFILMEVHFCCWKTGGKLYVSIYWIGA